MEKGALYMNPETGSVATGKEWEEDQRELGFDKSELENLVEVRETVTEEEKEAYGDWMEVK